jgi:DNA-binding IclR family transcriptional regulator
MSAQQSPDGMAIMSSLDKMLTILDLFDDSCVSIQLDAAVQATGASRATAYRYLQSLCKSGLLAPATGGSYVLGPRVIELDRLVRRTDPLLSGASRLIRDASAKLNINIMLCAYYGEKVMCADIIWPDRTIPEIYERGRPMPMFRGAMAKTILANLSPYQLRNLMLYHADEIREASLGDDWDQFRTGMARLRKDGSCVTRAEVVKGLVGIGAPVFDADKRVLGSVVFAVSEKRFDKSPDGALGDEIITLAARITKNIASGAPKAPPRARASKSRAA